MLERAKRLREDIMIHKQNSRKKRKRELSKLRYNMQREEILIEKSSIIKSIARKAKKGQLQKEYNEKNRDEVNARQRKYDVKHRNEKRE